MGALSPTHWLIIGGVLLLLFGAKRLPETARGIGRSARILKSEMHEVIEPDRPEPAGAVNPPAAAALVQPAAPAEAVRPSSSAVV
jgi:sec-independent protein translocase protein TatA